MVKLQSPTKMTVRELKHRLRQLGQPTSGKKSILVARLLATTTDAQKSLTSSAPMALANADLPFRSRKRRRCERKQPHAVKTEPEVVSAVEAALEKIQAGEKANVEHVALADEHTLALQNRRQQR